MQEQEISIGEDGSIHIEGPAASIASIIFMCGEVREINNDEEPKTN